VDVVLIYIAAVLLLSCCYAAVGSVPDIFKGE
jgi:hypothetical protein